LCLQHLFSTLPAHGRTTDPPHFSPSHFYGWMLSVSPYLPGQDLFYFLPVPLQTCRLRPPMQPALPPSLRCLSHTAPWATGHFTCARTPHPLTTPFLRLPVHTALHCHHRAPPPPPRGWGVPVGGGVLRYLYLFARRMTPLYAPEGLGGRFWKVGYGLYTFPTHCTEHYYTANGTDCCGRGPCTAGARWMGSLRPADGRRAWIPPDREATTLHTATAWRKEDHLPACSACLPDT